MNLCDRIVRAGGPPDGGIVFDVGAGPGGLSRCLLQHPVQAVVALEKDSRMVPLLDALGQAVSSMASGNEPGSSPPSFFVKACDVLALDEAALVQSVRKRIGDCAGTVPLCVVGNLPFNVSTVLLLKWLHQASQRTGLYAGDPAVPLVLTFQREVARRLVARAGTAEYSRLSVISQLVMRVQGCFDIAPSAFVPTPKVHGAVVRFDPLPTTMVAGAGLEAVERVLSALFPRRRQHLGRAVRETTAVPREWQGYLLALADVRGDLRPQQLPPAQWARLARAVVHVERLLGQGAPLPPADRWSPLPEHAPAPDPEPPSPVRQLVTRAPLRRRARRAPPCSGASAAAAAATTDPAVPDLAPGSFASPVLRELARGRLISAEKGFFPQSASSLGIQLRAGLAGTATVVDPTSLADRVVLAQYACLSPLALAGLVGSAQLHTTLARHHPTHDLHDRAFRAACLFSRAAGYALTAPHGSGDSGPTHLDLAAHADSLHRALSTYARILASDPDRKPSCRPEG